jgi:hypothetical protein
MLVRVADCSLTSIGPPHADFAAQHSAIKQVVGMSVIAWIHVSSVTLFQLGSEGSSDEDPFAEVKSTKRSSALFRLTVRERLTRASTKTTWRPTFSEINTPDFVDRSPSSSTNSRRPPPPFSYERLPSNWSVLILRLRIMNLL